MLLLDFRLVFRSEQFLKQVEYSWNYSKSSYAEISIFHAETSAETISLSVAFLSFASIAFFTSL